MKKFWKKFVNKIKEFLPCIGLIILALICIGSYVYYRIAMFSVLNGNELLWWLAIS